MSGIKSFARKRGSRPPAHNGDGFARLTDGGEALGYGFAGIEHSVVGGALFYSALVVKVKSASSGGANNVDYFHLDVPLFYY